MAWERTCRMSARWISRFRRNLSWGNLERFRISEPWSVKMSLRALGTAPMSCPYMHALIAPASAKCKWKKRVPSVGSPSF